MFNSTAEFDKLIAIVEERIDEILAKTRHARQACSKLVGLDGYYSEEFLQDCYFVVDPVVPFPFVEDLGLDELKRFSAMDPIGITYKNTYFIKTGREDSTRLHCHELVHVAQWRILGARGFMKRYFEEWVTFGYMQAPLEKMAHDIDYLFEMGQKPFDVPALLLKKLKL